MVQFVIFDVKASVKNKDKMMLVVHKENNELVTADKACKEHGMSQCRILNMSTWMK